MHMTSNSKVIFLNLKSNYPCICGHIRPYSQDLRSSMKTLMNPVKPLKLANPEMTIA